MQVGTSQSDDGVDYRQSPHCNKCLPLTSDSSQPNQHSIIVLIKKEGFCNLLFNPNISNIFYSD